MAGGYLHLTGGDFSTAVRRKNIQCVHTGPGADRRIRRRDTGHIVDQRRDHLIGCGVVTGDDDTAGLISGRIAVIKIDGSLTHPPFGLGVGQRIDVAHDTRPGPALAPEELSQIDYRQPLIRVAGIGPLLPDQPQTGTLGCVALPAPGDIDLARINGAMRFKPCYHGDLRLLSIECRRQSRHGEFHSTKRPGCRFQAMAAVSQDGQTG